MSKGSQRRPQFVSDEVYVLRWKLAFDDSLTEKERNQIRERLCQIETTKDYKAN